MPFQDPELLEGLKAAHAQVCVGPTQGTVPGGGTLLPPPLPEATRGLPLTG